MNKDKFDALIEARADVWLFNLHSLWLNGYRKQGEPNSEYGFEYRLKDGGTTDFKQDVASYWVLHEPKNNLQGEGCFEIVSKFTLTKLLAYNDKINNIECDGFREGCACVDISSSTAGVAGGDS